MGNWFIGYSKMEVITTFGPATLLGNTFFPLQDANDVQTIRARAQITQDKNLPEQVIINPYADQGLSSQVFHFISELYCPSVKFESPRGCPEKGLTLK